MQESGKPGLLEISSDEYEGSPKMVFCPVCKALVVNEEEFSQCPHTLFITASICEGEYLFMSDAFKARYAKGSAGAEGDQAGGEIWRHAGYGSTLAVIAQTTYGSCCGSAYAAYTGFDCSEKSLTEDDLQKHKQFTLRRAAELALCSEEEI